MRKRLSRRPSPSMAVALLALFVALGGVGYSATGQSFILGQATTASTPSTLTAPVAGKALEVTNTSTNVAATALGLTVGAGRPPLTVNSSARVTNLNSDFFDGLNSTSFIRRGLLQSA